MTIKSLNFSPLINRFILNVNTIFPTAKLGFELGNGYLKNVFYQI